jgi:hypothetical protein
MANKKEQECFVIMPISDHKDYEKGHFKRVYEDVIIPACEKANFKAVRADDVEETDMIHLSILKKLIEAPMAICDLSTRNPNVLFELGLRQAFDKPVVLIQEKGTERIFDVSILRAYDYCKELKYKDVLDDQEAISKMLKGTEKAFVTGEGFNSVIKLLSLTQSATIKTIDDPNEQFKMQLFQMSSQMDDISSELRYFRNKERNRISNYENENEKERLINRRISDKLNNRLARDYEEFLHFFNRNNYDEMLRVYKTVMESPIRSSREKEMVDEIVMRFKAFEEELNNK